MVLWTMLSSHGSAVLMLTCFGLLVVLNYWAGRCNVLYPPFVFCAVWCVATSVYLNCPVAIDELDYKTIGILVGGAACLSIGALIGRIAFSTSAPVWFSQRVRNTQWGELLLLYCLFMVPIFFYETLRLVGHFNFSPEFLIAVKAHVVDSLSEGDALYGNKLVRSAPMVSILTAWLFVVEARKKLLVIVAITISIIFCVLTAGRSGFLMLICGIFVLVIFRRPNRTFSAVFRRIAVISTLGVVVMTLFTLLVKQETQTEDGLKVASTMTAVYIAGPLAGFNYRVLHPGEFEGQPHSTFAAVLLPLTGTGLFHLRPMPVFEDFVQVPFPINVFTFYKPYYQDFGVAGCLVLPFAIGFLSSFVFEASMRGNQVALFLLCVNIYIFAYSTFTTLNQFALYAYTAAYAVSYFGLLSRLPIVRLPRAFVLKPTLPGAC